MAQDLVVDPVELEVSRLESFNAALKSAAGTLERRAAPVSLRQAPPRRRGP